MSSFRRLKKFGGEPDADNALCGKAVLQCRYIKNQILLQSHITMPEHTKYTALYVSKLSLFVKKTGDKITPNLSKICPVNSLTLRACLEAPGRHQLHV